ncbi:HD domain-containing protein [Pseudomonas sp. BMS12]|uniref:HD domain-containing protein n=1 Tax=Pseudomonas sp. BMS12 TaxID=1796033 RepID=UPI00083AC056|nr:hypothetical protein [Pseudomonas sp. BMS12]
MLDPQRWQGLWQQLGSEAPAGSFAELQSAYATPGRHYHSTRHIQACLDHFDRWQHLADNPALVELALWTHDLVYDTHRQDNEAASAQRACQWLDDAELGKHEAALRELILATCHQQAPEGDDAALVVDIDLAILASKPNDYAQYEAAVRAEYAWVPEALFRAGRAKLLKQLLAMPALYHQASLAKLWEAPARRNLQAALAALESQSE